MSRDEECLVPRYAHSFTVPHHTTNETTLLRESGWVVIRKSTPWIDHVDCSGLYRPCAEKYRLLGDPRLAMLTASPNSEVLQEAAPFAWVVFFSDFHTSRVG